MATNLVTRIHGQAEDAFGAVSQHIPHLRRAVTAQLIAKCQLHSADVIGYMSHNGQQMVSPGIYRLLCTAPPAISMAATNYHVKIFQIELQAIQG
jgi:hypothetical protein